MWFVDISSCIYSRLIRFYPLGYRRRFGDEQAVIFRDQARDAFRAQGKLGVGLLWVKESPGVLRTAVPERLAVLRKNFRRDQSPNEIFPPRLMLYGLLAGFYGMATVYPSVMAFLAQHVWLYQLGMAIVTVGTADLLFSTLRSLFSERQSEGEPQGDGS